MDPINHPCFDYLTSKTSARLHLPVAPDCNIQCSFCNRAYDCINESRPGVTSKILTPEQALDKFLQIKKNIPNLSIVGFAGPGDPLANFEQVKQSIELIKKVDNHVNFCLSTNGLWLPKYADEIINAGFSYVTITINAVTTAIAAKIYTRVDVEQLLKNQMDGLEYLATRGIFCKVNTLYLPGINEHEIEDIARKVSENGAYMMNIKNVVPDPTPPSLNEIREKCSKYIKQMRHCRQCRADSIGLLEDDKFKDYF
ncbi:MAG: hypothetical protein A2Y25_08605 [Candidatus Melainabacteria bacterium GWF2_37_15]|nr:MAG: hypothetical protein A2Y25_08605 [Candidatus Melainabacteria bacterium GWF2_37_15]